MRSRVAVERNSEIEVLLRDERLEVGEVRLDGRVGVMVRKGAIHVGVDREMLARQFLDELLERGTGGAVAGVPTDAERSALEALHQAIDVGVEHIDLVDMAMALGPVAVGGAAADLLDLIAEDRAAVQEHLEPVVVGRVVAPGDLDSALHAQRGDGEIEHRAGSDADVVDVDAAFDQAADQLGREDRRVSTAVPAYGDAGCAFICGQSGESPAERISIGLIERFSDDTANVVFTENGAIEGMGH